MHGERHDLQVVPQDEIALRSQVDNNQFRFATRNMEMYAQDQREWRAHIRHSQHIGAGLIIFFVLCFIAFCWLALSNGKSEMILDVLKVAGAFAGGGGVGYAVGFQKAAGRPSPPPQGNP